ncbi:MAG: VWA domain-containing protein [Candidatus Eremiobacteraeota bacterium]|nr:VWA domain-containing protein [Candidatus Eremiobacteraeota bacterium]
MRFVHPEVLFGIPAVLLFLWWSHSGRVARRKSLGFSSLYLVEWSKSVTPLRLHRRTDLIHLLFWVLLLLGLARPQQSLGEKPEPKKGIDIMLCLDTSSSMEAPDLRPNRLEAAKAVSKAFVKSRPDDRLGLVVYAGIALTQCPLTSDHATLDLLLSRIFPGITGRDGTAIGNAIATCVNRLKDLPGESKVVILLTDGRSNAGEIEPVKAAELAAEYGVRIYAIGVGTESNTGFMFGAGIDMETLHTIARTTGGKAFRATNNEGLAEIYSEIDRLEKVERDEKPEILYRELMVYPISLAFLLLCYLLWRRHRRSAV